MNSLKTLYSRITTLPASVQILESVGIAVNEIGESGEQVRPVSDILGDLAGKWHYLSASQQQNIAVQIAGRNQLSRFLALMNGYDTAVSATTTALNSQGSAVRENQAYMDSYEAKLNKMKNSFTELAQSMGNAFVKSGLTLGISAIEGLTRGLIKLIDTFGLLPTVAGTAFAVFSRQKTIAPMTQSIVTSIEGMGKKTAEVSMQMVDNLATVGNTGAKDMFKGWRESLKNMDRTVKVSGTEMKTLKVNMSDTSKVTKVFGDETLRVSASTKQFGGSMKVVNSQTNALTGVMTKVTSAARIMGSVLKTALVTAGIGLAIAAIGWAIEKLVNHFAKAKKEAEDLKQTNQLLVDNFRSSGQSIAEMADRYSELYAKYGEFHDAVSSGAIDAKINTEDYEDYERIVNELSNKLPTVVEYTDAEGRAHLRSADAVQKQVEYVKQLSQQTAIIEKQQFAKNLSKDLDEAEKAFKKLGEAQKELDSAEVGLTQEKRVALQKELNALSGAAYGDAIRMGEIQRQLNQTEAQQAEGVQKALMKQIQAREAVQSVIADTITTVKGYATVTMEAEGMLENLGSKSKALVENFALANSSYLEAIPDLVSEMQKNTKDADFDYAETLRSMMEERAGDLASASEQFANVLNNAFNEGVKGLDMSGSLAEDAIVLENYSEKFEHMTQMIPKSMITIDETTGQLSSSVIDLAGNFQKLGEVDDGIASKEMTYSEARLALGELGITGREADQMIRNFGQAAGNAEIQASLLATTVDESADAMSDLKTATLDTVDALSEITGVSSGNVSALKSYVDGIKQSKSAFGDAYESSELFGKSIAGMATYFGMSEEGVKNNMGSILLYEEALGAVTIATDDAGNATMEVAEMSAEAGDVYAQATERMKENGLSLETNLQMVLGLIPDISEAFKSVGDIDFSNVEDETAKLATSFLTAKDGSDEFKEAVLALGDSYPDLMPIRDMLSSFYDQIQLGTATWEDLEDALDGQLEGPEIEALIAKMKEIAGVEDEVKEAHDETKEKLAEPLIVEAKPLGVVETKERLGELGFEVGNLDGQEATLYMFSETALAQQGINELSQLALDLDMTEAEVKVMLEGASTAQEQAFLLAEKIADLEGKGRTADEVLGGLGANTNLEPMNAGIEGTKTKLESMNTAVADSQSNILAQIDGLNGAFNDLDLGIGKVEGLKDILGQLSGATATAKDAVLTATGTINTNLLNVKANGDTAVASMSTVIAEFGKVASSAQDAGLALDGFRTSTLGVSGNMATIASSAGTARDAMSGYSTGLITATFQSNSATNAALKLVAAKLNEARTLNTVKQSVTQAGSAYTLMTTASNTATGRINASNLTIGRSVITLANTYKKQMQSVSQAMASAASAVASRTGAMNNSHNSQISRLQALGNAARDAQAKVSSLNSSFSTAMRNMSSFITRAVSTANQATKTQNAVQKMKNATSGGIVGAIGGVLFGRGINDIVTAIREDSDAPVSVNLGALHGGISDGGSLSANAGESSSVSGLGGTSGTIQPSVSLSSYHGASGEMVFSASAERDEKHEDAYKINSYDRQYSALAEAMARVEGAMKRVSEESAKYRGNLQDIINLESKRLGIVNRELSAEKSRKASIERQLKQLPAVGRQTVAQRKKYNELQKQYDETLSSITSLTKTQEDLKNSAIENQRKQFESLIAEIVSSYDRAVNIVKAKLEEIDFKIDLLEYTDPDNVAKKTQLLVQKQTELLKQESHLRNMEKSLTSQYNSAKSKYGANDERTLLAKKELDDATSALRSVTLAVKKTEKEIKDIRADVASDSIKKLQDYYGNMKSMAKDAIEAEQKALEDAFSKREKLYDKEISKIEEVYSAKVKSMEDAENENEYQEQMASLEADRTELQRQIASASRDTSLQGKKNLKELQESLADTNKEIADAQKARQKELLKEQMEKEKDAQIQAIEDARALDEEQTDAKIEELEDKAKLSDQFYSDLLDDDKFWDKMQKDVVNGKFGGLISELENMYKNIANMNNGVFDGLLEEFSSFSNEAKKEFGDLNSMLLGNMQYSGGTNSANIAKQLAGTSTVTGSTNQKALGTPTWMTGSGGYSVQNVLTSSGTAPTPPKSSKPNSPAPKPVVGGTYEVKRDVGAYYTSDDAKARRSKRGTVKKGTYWVYNIWIGMINVTNKKGAMGSWINPDDNKGGLTSTGSVVAKSIGQDSAKLLEDGNTASEGVNIASGALSSMAGGNGGLSARSGDSISANGVGGTSGLLRASAETTAKIMEQARGLMPNLNIGNVADALGSLAVVNGGDVTYHTEINIDKMSGKKKDTENLLSVIDDKMRRIGK